MSFAPAVAQQPEWLDTEVNQINRRETVADYFAYENMQVARDGVRSGSDRYMSLEGKWRFDGTVFDVGNGGRHPILRYSRPVLLGVSL